MTGLDGTKLGVTAALIFGTACSTGAADGTGTTTTTTHGGTGAKTTTSTTTASTTSGGTGGMGGAGGCNPPPAAGTFWAQSGQEYAEPEPTPMCNYTGNVLLVVNTADA